MANVNPIKSLMTILQNDETIMILTGGLFFGGELPRDQMHYLPRKCLVLLPSPTSGAGGYAPLDFTNVDTYCYGASHIEAYDIDLEVYRVIKNINRESASDMIIYSATMTSGPVIARDPESDWPYVMRTYNVLTSD